MVLVIFVFLRNLPATVIPSLALPVSLLGTFALMWWAGYSLDNLSLMALTLAVGFVVDDAIVMLENVVRHMEMGKPPLQAALDGSGEVAFTIVSMTISLAAVFLPILFMPGLVGRLFHEFAVTIGSAILVSGLVSLTLTPMLCARFLRHAPHAVRARAALPVDGARLRGRRCASTTAACAGRSTTRGAVMAFSALVLVAMVPLWMVVPKGFLPTDDTGRMRVSTEGPEGTSFEAMVRAQRAAAAQLSTQPDVEQFMSTAGTRGVAGVTQGSMFLKLKDRHQRRHIDATVADIRARMTRVPGLRVIPTVPPPISLGGAGGGRAQYTVTLADADLPGLYRAAPDFEKALRALPELQDVTSDLRLASPRLKVEIDRDRAALLGVPAQAVEEALYSVVRLAPDLDHHGARGPVPGDPGAAPRAAHRSPGPLLAQPARPGRQAGAARRAGPGGALGRPAHRQPRRPAPLGQRLLQPQAGPGHRRRGDGHREAPRRRPCRPP